MIRVFISYAHEDIAFARKLYKELKASSDFDPWLDKECLLGGMKWRPAIRKAIRESRFFIALLSSRSTTKKGYFHSELREALEVLREFPEDQIFLIPTRLDECDPPVEPLKEIHHIDFFPDWDKGFKKLLDVIHSTSQQNNKKEPAPLKGYEYRCGIVDLDAGLTNIPQIAERLNSIQDFFHFTCPTITLSSDESVRPIHGDLNRKIDELPLSVYEQMQYLNVDFVVCITKYPLAFEEGDYIYSNYFSKPSSIDERFMFVSTHLLYEFAKQAFCTFEKGLVYITLSQLLVYFTALGYHRKTRGCVMDFCGDRSDMVIGLKSPRLCTFCLPKIRNPRLFDTITSILTDDMRF